MPAPNLSIFIKMSGGTLPPNTRAGDVEIYDNGRMVIFESDTDIVERQVDRNLILDILRFAREQGFFQLPNVVHDSDSPTVPDVTINLVDNMGNATVTMTGYQKLRGEMRQGPFDKVYKRVTDLAWQSYTTGQAPAPQAAVPQQSAQPPMPQQQAQPMQQTVSQPDNFQIAPPPFAAPQEKPVPFELPSLDEILKQSNLDFGDKVALDQPAGKIPHLPPLKAAQAQPMPEQSVIGDDSLQQISLPPLPNLSFQEPQAKIPHLPPLKAAGTVTKQGAPPQQAPQQQNQPKQQPAQKPPQQQQQPKAIPAQQNQPKQQPSQPQQQQPKPQRDERPQPVQQQADQSPKRVDPSQRPQPAKPQEQPKPIINDEPVQNERTNAPQAHVAPKPMPEQPRLERPERVERPPERQERTDRQEEKPIRVEQPRQQIVPPM
jgi:hypothetical protein